MGITFKKYFIQVIEEDNIHAAMNQSNTATVTNLAEKPMRKCRYCGQYAYHDARNCPFKRNGFRTICVAENVEKDYP
ncbi:hypothetical protein Tco_1488805 [Tanacetum coccineum]